VTWRVGVDVGGTFTDFCVWDGRTLRTHKLPSTPQNFAAATLEGLDALAPPAGFQLTKGTTVATNALLQRRGERTALITTDGFRDVLRIGRQARPDLYSLHVKRAPGIIAPEDCYEVIERVDSTGHIVTPLDEASARAALQRIRDLGVTNVAVCLLFSYLNPAHESRIAVIATELGLRAHLSSDLLPEVREFERASTTAVNASISPVMTDYLLGLDAAVRTRGARHLSVMQSNGGQISAAVAAAEAVRTVLSGPAAGVVAAVHVARRVGFERIITYDMGGTSTDVCVCDGEPAVVSATEIAGWPIRVPMLAIHTVGAGGGSIARLDAGGALRVGPESAGADPGPACYGRGDDATVTDANLVLGRIVPSHFLGGRMPLDASRSAAAIQQIATRVGAEPGDVARSILAVAEAAMVRAVKHVSAVRGYDPAGFMLLSFGGAGGLHACALADALGMEGVIVPAHPGVLSAMGAMMADRVKDHSRSAAELSTTTPDVLERLRKHYAELMERAALAVQIDGFEQDDCVLDRFADMRYRGQSHEITVPVEFLTDARTLVEPFHAVHEARYGFRLPDSPVEIVTLRIRSTITTPPLPAWTPATQAGGVERAILERRPVMFDAPTDTPIFDREKLAPGDEVTGPAVIVEPFATTLVPPTWHARVHDEGHLVLPHAADGGAS
jgi:N-methylhydantoinase A